MTCPSPTAKSIPDPRGPDRRQRDGLGLLPRATTPGERQRRRRLNRLIGWLLALLGLGVAVFAVLGGPLTEWTSLVTVVCGALIARQGVHILTWRDRRKADRRKPKTAGP